MGLQDSSCEHLVPLILHISVKTSHTKPWYQWESPPLIHPLQGERNTQNYTALLTQHLYTEYSSMTGLWVSMG